MSAENLKSLKQRLDAIQSELTKRIRHLHYLEAKEEFLLKLHVAEENLHAESHNFGDVETVEVILAEHMV